VGGMVLAWCWLGLREGERMRDEGESGWESWVINFLLGVC
jgi:hypothetical protein